MKVTPFRALACPLDGDPLHRAGSAWRCAAGHSFDVARQGYTHLLPVQKKRSRDPGDSKEMVAARRRFLNAGFYQPIATALNRATLADLTPAATVSCLDAGCGEGYYLRQLATAPGDGQTLALMGLDISKWAVLAAAKQAASKPFTTEQVSVAQGRQPCWAVGSNANLPVLSGTLDRVLCVFGFPVYSEFARVLKAEGQLLQVEAGPDHLRELREIIYPILKPERTIDAPAPEGFTARSTESVRYPLDITSARQVADLLAMTPHHYRANADGRAKAAALTSLSVTVDVRLTCWERSV